MINHFDFWLNICPLWADGRLYLSLASRKALANGLYLIFRAVICTNKQIKDSIQNWSNEATLGWFDQKCLHNIQPTLFLLPTDLPFHLLLNVSPFLSLTPTTFWMQGEDSRLYLFVLVGRDGDELGLFEGNVGNQTMARADAHDVKLRLVLMERVQHDLRTQRGACSHLSGPVYTHFYQTILTTLYPVCTYFSLLMCKCTVHSVCLVIYKKVQWREFKKKSGSAK